uniref:Zinc finger protein 497 n=1 Tax=Bactrocera latifrons TaxID=174628 RepID=A0A0K8W5V4_BACLA
MTICCRICFEENPKNFCLYKCMRKKYLPSVIFNISGVKVTKKLEPEAHICRRCAASILVAEKIISRCQESEEFLQFRRLKEICLSRQSPTPKTESSNVETYEKYQPASACSELEESLPLEPNGEHLLQSVKQLHIIKNENTNNSKRLGDNESQFSDNYEPAEKRLKSKEVTSVSSFDCDRCDFTTKIGKRFIEHKQIEHGVYDPNIYTCTICSESFSWKPTLYRHIEIDHKILPADKKHLCNECGRAYMREVHLLEHIKQRHGPRCFKCPDPLCEQSFTRTFTLRRHFITTHTEQTSSRYHCVDCKKYFKVYDQWKYHNEVIHKNEIVYCPHCGYPFRFKEKLDEHILKDICKRSIVPCSYCQRRFTTKCGLREHVRNIHNIY